MSVVDSQAGAPQRPAAPPPAWGASTTPPTPPQRRPAEPFRQPEPVVETNETRKLIVGRDINLSGEITACDHLIVEGTVEARVRDCFRLEVAESGLFQGSVEISEADIAGRFLGEIIVHGRLSVRATGKVEGKIHYGELAVDAGGTLDGEVRVNDASPKLVKEPESKVVSPAPLRQPAPPKAEAEAPPPAPPAEPKADPEAPNLL
jgi:cytoskeletal protein CcmA (bactofilin family)